MNHYEEMKNMSLEDMAVRLSQIAACAYSKVNNKFDINTAVNAGIQHWTDYLKTDISEGDE